MKFKNSLFIPIIFVLIAVGCGTLCVGYYINIHTLQETLETREADKARATYRFINSQIEEEVNEISALSNLLKRDSALVAALAHYHKSHGDLRPLQQVMERLYAHMRKWDPDIFLVTDGQGKVVYQVNSLADHSDAHLVWGMDEALTGEDIITASHCHHGWEIQALAPLYAADKLSGVLVVGVRLTDNFAQKIAAATNTNVSFCTSQGIWASSWPPAQRNLIDLDAMYRSIYEKRSLFHNDYYLNQSFLYIPLRVADETFCLIINSDTYAISEILKQKRTQLISSFLLIFLMVMALGSGLTFSIIRPLRKLRSRAQGVIKEFAGEDLPLRATGNEIQTLSQAFNLMLSTIHQYISGVKQAEEALRDSEKKYRLLVSQIPAMVFQGYGDWSIDPLDEKVEVLTGYAKEDFDSRRVKWCDLIPAEDLDYAAKVFIEALKTDKSYVREHRLRKKDGEIIWVQCRGQIFCHDQGKVDHISGVSFDVTQRRQAEEAVREGERFLADVFASIQDGINIMDTDYNIIRVNPIFDRWYEHARPLVGKKCYKAFHGRQEPCEICPYRQTLETGKAAYKVTPREGKDGAEAGWLEVFTFPITDPATGQVKGVIQHIRDITERQRAEEALQERERFLTSIFASIQDGISVLDNEYNIVRVNPAMERDYAQAMPLVGKKCYEAYHGSRESCDICPARTTLETGAAAREMVIVKGAAGEMVRYVDLYTFPLMDMSSGQMQGVVEYVRDVTEQKQAEEALHRSEAQLSQAVKMEAVGRLAGGVAHDFNNILTAIIGYGELLLMNLDQQDPQRQDVQDILVAAERAATLTRQLLAFSRKQVLQPQRLALNRVVANMDKMLRRIIGEDIDLVTVLGPEPGTVTADPGQIEQVIMNLAVNARDAMPQGGKLTIETADADLDEAYAQNHLEAQPGPYVMLAVSDTGVGLDQEAQARIFEPFFTTKELGKGTGLGLSTVYGIVKQSGGLIWVYSEPGKGTTFKIYLPRLEAAGDLAAGLSQVPGKCEWGSETVLLVEDEDMVRHVARRILARHGYTVLEAASGDDALAISRENAGPIHLMLTDVVMPGMSGRETADNLKPQRPGMKVLFMSGHTENAIVHHGVLDPGTAFIQKPFKYNVLAQKIREVLDKPAPG